MARTPALIVAIKEPRKPEEYCFAQRLLYLAENMCDTSQASCKLGRSGAEIPYPLLVATILHATSRGDEVEGWIRVQGEQQALAALQTVLRREKELAFQVVAETKHNILVKTLMPLSKWCGGCRFCPYIDALPNTMPVSIVLTSQYIVFSLIASRPQVLKQMEDLGFKILDTLPVTEYEDPLTSKQEIALVLAYLYGYYAHPRRTSIRELASKLGMSGSALAELLRKAELKVIKSYVIGNLVHHIYITIKQRTRERD